MSALPLRVTRPVKAHVKQAHSPEFYDMTDRLLMEVDLRYQSVLIAEMERALAEEFPEAFNGAP